MSGAFDVARFLELRRAAGAPTWADPLHYTLQTGSTNDDALAAARQGAPGGSLFLTEHQTAGRGRRGRHWLAASGQSLLFSVLLRPSQPATPAATSALTLAVGLGTRAALAAHSMPPLSVKWPNDILAARRKLAGILCESQLRDGHVDAIVIGVGINVGRQAFPPELTREITCLEELAAAPVARELVLLDVLTQIERRVAACERSGLSELLEEFRQHDALRDQRVTVSAARELVGVARGVDEEGRLLLETEGVLLPVGSGTVRWA
jgi:BirA family biotin operon repressor/biotin-[acetyl-CoA-carboxylase] ligase